MSKDQPTNSKYLGSGFGAEAVSFRFRLGWDSTDFPYDAPDATTVLGQIAAGVPKER